MELFLGALSIVLIIIAFLYFRKIYNDSKKAKKSFSSKNGNVGGFINCPLCQNPLKPGQNLFSKVFGKQGEKPDQLCYVYGCPNCFPVTNVSARRTCPVCHKEIGKDGYLIARMFNHTKSGKPHVIINGCGNCNGHHG